jgi:hypothetical protein
LIFCFLKFQHFLNTGDVIVIHFQQLCGRKWIEPKCSSSNAQEMKARMETTSKNIQKVELDLMNYHIHICSVVCSNAYRNLAISSRSSNLFKVYSSFQSIPSCSCGFHWYLFAHLFFISNFINVHLSCLSLDHIG